MAALSPLAEIEDVEDRMGRALTAEETSRVAAALRDASAVVRGYTRRKFVESTDTVRIRPRGWKVILPQGPVVSVDSVSLVSSFGATEWNTPALFSWVAGTELLLADQAVVYNAPTIDCDGENVWAEVTYTYGYSDVPDDIIAVVANMAVRQMTLPGGGVIDSETIGPYTTRYAGSTTAGPLSLSEPERRVLNLYRTTNRTVELR